MPQAENVVNEPELLRLLQGYGFVAMEMESCSWIEQVALFQQAEAIAGPHGAGLANLIFCAPGTIVIELMPETYANRLYEELSLGGRLDYRRVDVELLSPGEPGASNMKVDVVHAETVLRSAFGTG